MCADSLVRRWLPIAAIVVLVGWTGLGLAQEKPPAETPDEKDIVAVARSTSDLKTFCRLLESADLVNTLKGKGPYTVLAPTDEAFKKLGMKLDELQKPENKAELQRVLKHHVLEGRQTAADMTAVKSVKTLAGDRLTIAVKDDVVTVDTANLTKTDIKASNGLIHIVDTVLMPKEPEETELQP